MAKKRLKDKPRHARDSANTLPIRSLKKDASFYVFLLLVANLAAYSNCFKAGWHFDDGPSITNNPDIQITDLSWASLTQAAASSPGGKRPIAYLSFAFNYYCSGDNATSYHAFNLLLHCLNALLVLLIVQKVLATSFPALSPQRVVLLAFLAAGLWSVNPIQTQSVTYVVQRMTLLSTFFALGSFVYFLQWRSSGKWWHMALCLVSWLLGVRSKENSALLPLVFVAYEWVFGSFAPIGQQSGSAKARANNLTADEGVFGLKGHVKLHGAGICLAAVSCLFFFALWRYDLIRKVQIDYARREFTLEQRLMTQPRVIVFHFSQLLLPLPSRLALRHEVEKSTSLLSPPTTLASMALLLGMAGLTVFARRGPYAFAGFWGLWFFVNLLVESTFLPLEMIYEHRMYLPSVGFFAAPFCLLAKASSESLLDRWKKPIGGLILASVALSWSRNQAWRDEVTLWSDNASKYPNSVRSWTNLGSAYIQTGQAGLAQDAFRRAFEADSDYPLARANLGLALLNQGRIEDALAVIRDFSEIPKPGARPVPYFTAEVYFNFGVIYAKAGMIEEAISHYLQAVNRRRDYPEALFNLGLLYTRKGNGPDASRYFREFLERWKGPNDSPYVVEAQARLAETVTN